MVCAMTLQSISVGIDPSRTSAEALAWAAGLAEESQSKLRVVRSWQMPLVAALPEVVGALPTEHFLVDQANEEVDAAIIESGITYEIERVVRQGSSGPVLVEEGADSDLLVVGRTGRGRRHGISRLAEVVLGSTARYCVHHAHRPVAAVPHGSEWVDNPRVVIGIDGSAASVAALRWALDNLPATCDLHAVWALPYWTDGLIAIDSELFQHAQERAGYELEACVVAATDSDPERRKRVVSRVESGTPRTVLTDSSPASDIVIVGDRGRSNITAKVLGSIADHVVRYSKCPVIVVPSS